MIYEVKVRLPAYGLGADEIKQAVMEKMDELDPLHEGVCVSVERFDTSQISIEEV